MHPKLSVLVVPVPLWETIAGIIVQLGLVALIVWIVIRQTNRKTNKPN